MQTEYTADFVSLRLSEMQDIYQNLTRTVNHSTKPDNTATFLGHTLNDSRPDEMGNDFRIGIEGTRIGRCIEQVLIKMYDE